METIFNSLGYENVQSMLDRLDLMVKVSVRDIKLNYADLHNAHNLHAYCLAIYLYLGHFEQKPSVTDEENPGVIMGEIDIDYRPSNLLAFTE